MKSVSFYLLSLSMVVFLAACGKSNESGKKNNRYTSPYFNGQYGSYTNTPYAYAGQNVGAVLQQTWCHTTGMPTQQRMQIQFPLSGYPSVIPRGDIYVGVTTAGDVAVLVGQGNNAPLFVAYMCQRGYATGGSGQLLDLATGSSTQCNFKPLVRATMYVPGMAQPLYFRYLEAGKMTPQGQIVPYTQPVCRY